MTPNLRAAKPRKWFWLSYIIPTVSVYANVTFIGFVRNGAKDIWHPVLKGRHIRINHNGSWLKEKPWSIPKVQIGKAA